MASLEQDMQLDDVPRFSLVHAPTPLQPLERLTKHLGGPQLFIKRDDCTGLALGGNKTRKLEFLIGEALKQGATAIVSEGGIQSNHVRQTAAAAVKAGLRCHLVLERNVPIDDPIYRSNGNFLLDRLLGATLHICKPGETRAARSERLVSELRAQGEVPYHIPTGGSNPVGALGYVAGMLELLQQAEAEGLSLDRIVAACSSGGTQAGLLVGRELARSDAAILGVDIGGDFPGLTAKIQSIAEGCAQRVGMPPSLRPAAIEIDAGYAAPGYGMPNAGMLEAVKLMATLEGILLDPVYTGKAMAGLIGMIREGRFGREETVVFIHTGGMPALFAYPDCF
jgi:L-cysteate sulfo-lyase